jgi:1-pyrroline-5-carboxylate dehydrogenase
MGNVVLWKPSDYAIAANWLIYSIFQEAGLPPNVIQFVPGDPQTVTDAVLAHRDFAALHFTGSTSVFRSLYGKIGAGVSEGKYRSYPRIVGETGGKNFHLVHRSADVDNAVYNTVRGAFEYQGQKCSATSRVYVPSSLWAEFKEKLVTATNALKMGPADDARNFVGPLIHAAAFARASAAIDAANADPRLQCLAGGHHDGATGFFVRPSVYATTDPAHELLARELFAPILLVYVYDDEAAPAEAFRQVCELIDRTSDYALTGAVFARDREAVRYAEDALRNCAGNFYINTKCTGAVVAQQPFGGARASGTNE